MKFKVIFASAVCAVMCANTAFAAQPTEEEKIVLTYDKAVEMAIDNNSNMATLDEAIDYMQKSNKVVVESLGASSAMLGGVSGTIGNAQGSLLTSAKTLESNIKTSKYSRELIETGSEFLVKTYFNNIMLAESGLEMLEKSYNIEQDKYSHTKFAIENAYDGLGTALGLSPNEDFTLNYEIAYVPFTSDRSVESHISTAISKDPSIKISETNLNLAERLQEISVYEPKIYSYLEKENNVNSASRDLKDAKQAMESSMTAAYNNIKTYEAERVALEADLQDAKTMYATAKTNYELGNIAEMDLKQAELGVLSAENKLLTNASNHDIEVFGFNNPSVLGSAKK